VLEARSRDQHIGRLKQHDVALYIGDMEEPLIISLVHDLLLGLRRCDSGASEWRRFKAWNKAYRAGMPCCGASGWTWRLSIWALNGTWLSGVEIQPHQPVILRSSVGCCSVSCPSGYTPGRDRP
jgi:hypothetical protein